MRGANPASLWKGKPRPARGVERLELHKWKHSRVVLIPPARKFRMLLHINPTHSEGNVTGPLAHASGWYMTFFAAGVIGEEVALPPPPLPGPQGSNPLGPPGPELLSRNSSAFRDCNLFPFLRGVVLSLAGMPRRPAESSGQPRPSSDFGRGIASASGGRLRARPGRPSSSGYPSLAR